MARPKKEGLDYFPLDVGFFEDKKIKILRARYGADGLMVYLYYICRIYDEKGYYLIIDEDFDYTTSLDLGMSVEKIGQIRKFLLERSLLDSKLFQSDTILTARSIQSRFQEAKKSLKRPVVVMAKFWLLEEFETESFIKLYPCGGLSENNLNKSGKNPDKSKINDIKESKGKESKGECVSPALVSYGAHGWIRVEEQTYLGFVSAHGQAEVDRIVKYIDELCQSNGNKYKWTDWAMVLDRALQEKWGTRQETAGSKKIDHGFPERQYTQEHFERDRIESDKLLEGYYE